MITYESFLETVTYKANFFSVIVSYALAIILKLENMDEKELIFVSDVLEIDGDYLFSVTTESG